MAQKTGYSSRLPDRGLPAATRTTTGIAIIHTVDGTAHSTFDRSRKDRTGAGDHPVVASVRQ